VRGEGVRLFDDTGRSYIDGSGGAFVVNIGHGVAEIGEAMARQASRVAYVNGTMFTNEPVDQAAIASPISNSASICDFAGAPCGNGWRV